MVKRRRRTESLPPAGMEPEPDSPFDRTSETVDIRPPPGEGTVAMPAIDDQTVFTGPILRQVREARGVALKSIAERTKVNALTLAAVEEERYDDLPGVKIYIRGFVRCLAQEIGLDPDKVASSYLERWQDWFEQREVRKRSSFSHKP
jgi:hypothetical protein